MLVSSLVCFLSGYGAPDTAALSHSAEANGPSAEANGPSAGANGPSGAVKGLNAGKRILLLS